MLVKLSDAAWLVSRHERVVRRRLLLEEGKPGRLPARKDGQAWLIDTEDLKRFWTLDPARLGELEERHRKSPSVMSAQIATLQAQVKALESRIRTLEAQNGRQHVSAPNLSEQAIPPIREDVYTPLARPTGFSAWLLSPDGKPSVRGRSRWVEEHNGPKASGVRDWPDVPSWRGPEDAITSVRRHRGWEHWQPVGLDLEVSNDD